MIIAVGGQNPPTLWYQTQFQELTLEKQPVISRLDTFSFNNTTCRSLKGQTDLFQVQMTTRNFDVILLTETSRLQNR